MVRILHVVTDMRQGGLETMLMNYYRCIDKSIIQFDFAVHRTKRGTFDDEIEEMGGKIYRLPKLNPFNKNYKQALGKLFDEHPEYQIIHVHQDCMSSIILKIAKEHGVRVRIAHSHASSQDKNLKYPIKLFYKRLIPYYATHLFACSKEAGEWMFKGAPFNVLNNAIDAEKFLFNEHNRVVKRAEFDIGPEELLIGHIGRFSPPKNHEFLIDVFFEIQKCTKSKLLLVGDGRLRESIIQKVEKFGITDKVIFAGLRSDVAEILQAMDVFILPSIYEGLGIAVIEAQASGLPCIVSTGVSLECKKTDLVQQISLAESAKKWAALSIAAKRKERINTFNEIKESGYDIGENVRSLQEFYLSARKEK